MRLKGVTSVCAGLLLLEIGVTTSPADDSATVRAAATKSIDLLQRSGHTWIERAGCMSCHHQSLPAMAFALASPPVAVDDQMTRERAGIVSR